MARGLGLKRGDRESQKSQKSNLSAGSESLPSTPLQAGTPPQHGQQGGVALPQRTGPIRQFSAPNPMTSRWDD